MVSTPTPPASASFPIVSILPPLIPYHDTEPICGPTCSPARTRRRYLNVGTRCKFRRDPDGPPLPDGDAGPRLSLWPEGAGPAGTVRLRGRRPPSHDTGGNR